MAPWSAHRPRLVAAAAALALSTALPATAQDEWAARTTGPQNQLDRAQYEAGTQLLWSGHPFDNSWSPPGRNWVGGKGAIARTGQGGDLWFRNFRLPSAFDLSFDYQAGAGVAGGVSTGTPGQLFAIGRAGDAMPAGCAPAPIGGEAWRRGRIRAEAGRLIQWVDGQKLCETALPPADRDQGYFFLRLMDGPGTIRFRNLLVDAVRPAATFRISALAGLKLKVEMGDAVAAYAKRLHAELPPAPVRTLGLPLPHPAKPGPLTLEKLGEDAQGTYYRYIVPALEGLPGTGIIGVPAGNQAKLPVMIVLHGTGGAPEMMLNGITVYHRLFRGPLQDGYLVIAPQLYTFNRRELPFGNTLQADVVEPVETMLDKVGHPIFAVDTARILAALQGATAKWPVDPARIGVTGLSHGGHMALYVAAADPRIVAGAAASGFAPLMTPDIVPSPTDLLRQVAPRPFLLMAGVYDPFATFGAGWMEDYRDYVQTIYGAKGRLEMVADPAGHEYNWNLARAFFAETMPARPAK